LERAEIDALRTLADLIGTAITRERHLAEIAKANTIIQSSPTILYRLRGEASLPMTYISQNIGLLGHDSSELLAEPTRYREIIHPDDRQMVQSAMLALLHKEAQPIGQSNFACSARAAKCAGWRIVPSRCAKRTAR
jgi:hypothetical protein